MLAVDTVLQGRYRVLRQIERGGMGNVYEAADLRLLTSVALKEARLTGEQLRRQFEREARMLAHLRHPALTKVFDHFTEGDGQFLVMEYVPGSDLSEMMRNRGRGFHPLEVVAWADQLLDALEYLHTREPAVVHRDIKPSNLKLSDRGQIILLDFGLAKGGEMPGGNAESVVGYTLSYAPLEQIQGAGTGPRSDLYSLGATLYHLLTNEKPADALTRATQVVGSGTDPLTPPARLNEHVTNEFASFLTRSMALSQEDRPFSAAEMRRLLREASATLSDLTLEPEQASPLPSQRAQLPGVSGPHEPETFTPPNLTPAESVRRPRGGDDDDESVRRRPGRDVVRFGARVSKWLFIIPVAAVVLFSTIFAFMFLSGRLTNDVGGGRGQSMGRPVGVVPAASGDSTVADLRVTNDPASPRSQVRMTQDSVVYVLARINSKGNVRVRGRLLVERVAGHPQGMSIPGADTTVEISRSGTATFRFAPNAGWGRGSYTAEVILLDDRGTRQDARVIGFDIH